MYRRISIAISALTLSVLLGALAFGQVSSSLSGTVTDPTGAVLSGASVVVQNPATGTEFKATTSGSGTYTIPSLSTGTYKVTVSAAGFKTAVEIGRAHV